MPASAKEHKEHADQAEWESSCSRVLLARTFFVLAVSNVTLSFHSWLMWGALKKDTQGKAGNFTLQEVVVLAKVLSADLNYGYEELFCGWLHTSKFPFQSVCVTPCPQSGEWTGGFRKRT